MKRLADIADLTLGPALAAQGFAGREIVAHWDAIVGERLAARSRPQKIHWPRRRPGPDEEAEAAALVLRVEGAFALEMQQLAPLILQKVNAHLGWKAVDRIVLKQGPIEAASAAPALPAAPDAPAAMKDALQEIGNDEMRAALLRLGAAVVARKAAPGQPSG